MDYVKALHDIAVELVDDKEHLEVREMPSLDFAILIFSISFSFKKIDVLTHLFSI